MYFDLTKGNLSFIGKTRHHQDFHLNDAWFMFSNPVRQMPYISNFRGLLFYGHLSNGLLSLYLALSHYSRLPTARNRGANTRDTTVISLIRMLMEGPDVSLNGSPTVSPTTAAL